MRNLVPLGEIAVSPRIRVALDTHKLNAAPFLLVHGQGEGGELETADEIFEHIGDVCNYKRRVCSFHDTSQGRIRISTNAGRTQTVVAYVDELT